MGEQSLTPPPPYFVPLGYKICKSCNKAWQVAMFADGASICHTCAKPAKDDPTDYGWCYRCKEHKPREAFSASRRNKNGLQDWCKTCTSKYRAEYAARSEPTPRRANPVANGKECHRCHKIKPMAKFWKDRTKPDGRAPTCKSCANSRRRKLAAMARELPVVTVAVPEAKAPWWRRILWFI